MVAAKELLKGVLARYQKLKAHRMEVLGYTRVTRTRKDISDALKMGFQEYCVKRLTEAMSKYKTEMSDIATNIPKIQFATAEEKQYSKNIFEEGAQRRLTNSLMPFLL